MTLSASVREAAAKALFGGEPPAVCDELARESHSNMCVKCARYTRWEMALESVDAVSPVLAEGLLREVEELRNAGYARSVQMGVNDRATLEAQLAAAREALSNADTDMRAAALLEVINDALVALGSEGRPG